MKVYTLHAKQNLPITLDKAWEFFSDPKNLQAITPDDMDFHITSDLGDGKMYPGQIITYIVRPLMNIPMTWMTEINQVRDKEFFIDNQVVGPYKVWHHKHFFKEIPGGVECEDLIHYALPMGILGQLVHPIIVRPKLEHIFAFRKQKLASLFGEMK